MLQSVLELREISGERDQQIERLVCVEGGGILQRIVVRVERRPPTVPEGLVSGKPSQKNNRKLRLTASQTKNVVMGRRPLNKGNRGVIKEDGTKHWENRGYSHQMPQRSHGH